MGYIQSIGSQSPDMAERRHFHFFSTAGTTQSLPLLILKESSPF